MSLWNLRIYYVNMIGSEKDQEPSTLGIWSGTPIIWPRLTGTAKIKLSLN